MFQISACPVCDGQNFAHYLTCIDHTVSHETFNLIECTRCKLVITNPRPESRDLGKYYDSTDYISHSNSSRGLFDKAYQISRRLTLNWKLTLVSRNSLNKNATQSLLDYGCGTGEFLNACQKAGYEIAGVEPSKTARQQATSLTDKPITSRLDEIKHQFDIITLWHVLEHVEDLNEKVLALKKLLNRNGTMFIAVPNHNSFDAQYYKSLWAGYDVPRHLWHFNVNSMTELLKKHDLTVTKIIPMKLDSFYVSMLSEKYQNKKQSFATMIKGALRGFQSNISARNKNYSSQIFVVRK